MLKKTITYIDYNGVECTEDFHFHLSEAELLEMEMGTTGGLIELLEKMVKAKDAPAIIKMFKDLVLKAYGEKDPDGKHFMKSEQISARFAQTPAYSKLFMELATNHEAAAKFVNEVIPKDLASQVDMKAIEAKLN